MAEPENSESREVHDDGIQKTKGVGITAGPEEPDCHDTGEAAPVVEHDDVRTFITEGREIEVSVARAGAKGAEAAVPAVEAPVAAAECRGSSPTAALCEGIKREILESVGELDPKIELALDNLFAKMRVLLLFFSAIPSREYHEGNVRSLEYTDAEGLRHTTGVMLPGEYIFETTASEAERFLVQKGTVKLFLNPDRPDLLPIVLTAGHEFQIGPGQKFKVVIEGAAAAYDCTYIPAKQ